MNIGQHPGTEFHTAARGSQDSTALQIDVRAARSRACVAHPLTLDAALIDALPAARRVLVIGGDAALHAHLDHTHPGTHWQAAASVEAALACAREAAFDLIVMGTGLPTDAEPLAVLSELARLADEGASLVLQVPNTAKLATLERLIEADFSADDLPRDAHSPSSVFKLLLDAGWAPSLMAHRTALPARHGIAAAALNMADMLDMPRQTVTQLLSMDQLVIHATRAFGQAPAASGPARFTVVVPTTRDAQLRLNVECSPGLAEIGARIVTCKNAAHPAQALSESLPHCEGDWVLMCHQDVYFPRGFGHRLNEVLAAIPDTERATTLIGLAGMAVSPDRSGFQKAGFVIDRLDRIDHGPSREAVSIDELAIVLARDSVHRIDAQLGWHLWATDLCLQAITQHRVFARIERLPVFHNSITPGMPPAFREAARTLAAKHASFGPIPTLCATIDEHFLASPAHTAAPTLPALHKHALVLEPETLAIDALIESAAFEEASQAIYRAVHLSYTQPGIKHQALYYPAFDRQIERLAAALAREPGQQRSGAPGVPLIIATELYALGGHTRVLEEMSHEMHKPVLVLTDLFRTLHRDPAQLEALRTRFAHTQLMVLPDAPLWDKCRMLRTLVLHLAPRSTVYFGHHQDPIPFIGSLHQKGGRRLFIHHGDHNPSLGCTLRGVQHVDLITTVQALCAEQLDTPPARLPLYVADLGRKSFAPVRGRGFSVVTAGHPAKFSRSGSTALQDIVATTLGAVQGQHFHIGPLDDAWLAEIRVGLAARGIDPQRFVPVGLVPSVWEALKALDAAVYIGSAPVSGGRSGIEAQGCGYPVLCYRGFDAGSLLADYSSYADPALGWASLDELATRLGQVGDRHADLSRAARAFYEAEFSQRRFRKVLKTLLGA